jgi:hypothetical protein
MHVLELCYIILCVSELRNITCDVSIVVVYPYVICFIIITFYLPFYMYKHITIIEVYYLILQDAHFNTLHVNWI